MTSLDIQSTKELDDEMKKKLMKIGFIIEAEIVRKVDELGIGRTVGRFSKGRIGKLSAPTFRNSIKVNFDEINKGIVKVEDNVDYGVFLEFGTTAHFIKPVRKKYLKWVISGKSFFSKGHMVSGIPAYAPFRRGLLAALPKIEKILSE